MIYTMSVREIPPATLAERVRRILAPKAGDEAMATTADQLGAEGARAVLVRQLEKKFGPIPKPVRDRLDAALTPELGRWNERLFTASSLDEVFATD